MRAMILPGIALWFALAGTNFLGATNSSLKLNSVVPSQAGGCSVQTTNLFGTTSSNEVAPSLPPSIPIILLQPQSQFVPAGVGVDAIFSVSVGGTTPATNSIRHTISMTYLADFVYDRPRDILYIATGYSDIQRFHIGSNTFLSAISIVGTLASLDLSPDGNTLAVGDRSYGGTNSWIYLVDLQSNTPRQVLFDRPSAEAGIYSVAFGDDGAVLCTAQFANSASGGVRLRRYDPATDTTTVPRGVERDSLLTASGDGSMIAIAEGDNSVGPVLTYDVASRSVDGFVWTGDYISAPPGVNRNGTQFAEPTGIGMQVYSNAHAFLFSSGLSLLTTIGSQFTPKPSGVVYHPSLDLMFCGWSNTREMRAYETATFTEVAVFDFGAALSNGRLRFSRDGARLFGAVIGGINWIDWTNMAPSFASQPASQTIFAGSNVTFSARVFGTPQIEYQWQRNGVSLPGATIATLASSNVPLGSPADYSVIAYNPYGFVISTNATLTVVSPPFVTAQPQSQSAAAGSNATFTVAADGSTPLAYQWQVNGTNVLGATANSFSLADVQAINAAGYAVVIANSYGSVTSSIATLTVNPNPPIFVVQPHSETVLAGSNVTFTVTALGSEPLGYAWYSNGTVLANGGRVSGATTAKLSISKAQATDSGAYQMVVTNNYGSATSSVATLTVLAPAQIIGHPASQAVLLGGNASFTVTAIGSGTISYQWLFDGTPLMDGDRISGSATPTLSISNVQFGDAGGYAAVVTNLLNAPTSRTASLTPLTGAMTSVRYVNLNNTNPSPPYLNWNTAATNIQDAVDAAVAGDLILVSNGTYNVGGRAVYGASTNRVVIDKAVTVQSVNGAASTLIVGDYTPATRGGPNSRCAYLTNGAALIGFTLTNGGAFAFSGDVLRESSGGGVWCESGTAVVSNCVLTANTAGRYGGGAYQGTLLNCILTNNFAGQGGGACSNALFNCTLTRNFASFQNFNSGGGAIYSALSNCVLVANRCNGGGGGAAFSTLTSCVISNNTGNSAGGGVCGGLISNCLISSNRTFASGGGAYSNVLNNCVLKNNLASGNGGGAGNSTLNNCLLAANVSSSGFGGGAYGGTLNGCTLISNSAHEGGGASFGALYNCIVYYNTVSSSTNYQGFGGSLHYCCLTPLSTGAIGCITNEPGFIDFAGGKFHLQTNSPCVNAGNNSFVTNSTDLDGHPRIVGGTVDIGAYEFQTPSSLLSYAWLQQYGLPTDGSADYADRDGDGLNNWQEWRAGTDPTNALSVLRLFTPVPSPAGVAVTWQSVADRTYFLERSTNLGVTPIFLALASNLVGQAGATTLIDTNAAAVGPFFYRVGVQE